MLLGVWMTTFAVPGAIDWSIGDWRATRCVIELYVPSADDRSEELEFSWTDAAGRSHRSDRHTATGFPIPVRGAVGDPVPCYVDAADPTTGVLSIEVEDNFPAWTILVPGAFLVGFGLFGSALGDLRRARGPFDEVRSDRPTLPWGVYLFALAALFWCSGAKDLALTVVAGGPWWPAPLFGVLGLTAFAFGRSLRRDARRPKVAVAFEALPRAADPWTVTWSVDPPETLKALTLQLVGTEKTYQGDDEWKQKSVRAVGLVTKDTTGAGVAVVDIPLDVLPTRSDETYRVEWVVEARCEWADGEETVESFEVELLPVW